MSGTKDTNYNSAAETDGERVGPHNWVPPSDAMQFDDILKRSNCHNFGVAGVTIPGGREDAVDFVRGTGYTVCHCTLSGGVTIKGAIDGAVLDTVTMGGKPKIELGQFDNYWYPGRAPTRNVVLNEVYADNGGPVKVLVWDADMPTVIKSNVRVTRIPKIIWYPYFLFRYVCVRAQGLKTK